MSNTEVLIIGGGLTGLKCAAVLERRGMDFTLVEKSPRLGGRVKSEQLESIPLDCGFQVVLPEYPELKGSLELRALKLNYFRSGALIHDDGKVRPFLNPLHHPSASLQSLLSGVATPLDLALLTKLAAQLFWPQSAPTVPQISTNEYLVRNGFSERIINRFFLPFFRGVFLQEDLEREASEFLFYLRCFFLGGAAIPTGGMQALPRAFEQQVGSERVVCSTKVRRIDGKEAVLDDGSSISFRLCVSALDLRSTMQLLDASRLGHSGQYEQRSPSHRGTICLYYAVPADRFEKPILHLFPDSPITSIVPVSGVTGEKFDDGMNVISVNALFTEGKNAESVRREVEEALVQIFGDHTEKWTFLRGFEVPEALPSAILQDAHVPENPSLILAGDWTKQGSINGALESGRTAAETVLSSFRELQPPPAFRESISP